MMEHPWSEIDAAIKEFRRVEHALAMHAEHMANLLRGNLRRCNAPDLASLKHELRDFDSRTGSWRGR